MMIAFYLLFVGILTTIYMVIALRTNIVFVIIFLFLDLALFLLAAAYWTLAEGDTALGGQLEVVSGKDVSGANKVLMFARRLLVPASSFSAWQAGICSLCSSCRLSTSRSRFQSEI